MPHTACTGGRNGRQRFKLNPNDVDFEGGCDGGKDLGGWSLPPLLGKTLRPIEQSIAHDGSALDRGLMQK